MVNALQLNMPVATPICVYEEIAAMHSYSIEG